MNLSSLFRWNKHQFESARFGLITALLAVIVASFGMELTWRSMSTETQGFIEQSIGDTATLIAAHVRSEMDHLTDRLREGADSLPRAMPGASTFESDSDLIQVGFWKKPNEGAAQRTFGWSSPKFIGRTRGLDMNDQALVEMAFGGQIMIRAQPTAGDPVGAMWIAVPQLGPDNLVREVITAYVMLGRFQKIFRRERLVSALLVDSQGMVLGHADGKSGSAEPLPEFPLVQAILSPQNQTVPSLQMRFSSQGNTYYGGFQKVGIGGMSIVTSVSDRDARAGLEGIRNRSIAFILATLVVTFFLGYFYSDKRAHRDKGMRKTDSPRNAEHPHFGVSADGIATSKTPEPDFKALVHPKPSDVGPERGPRVVMFGALRMLGRLIDEMPEPHLVDAVNDVMTLACSRVREFGGAFEFHSGTSFNAIFLDGNSAIQCALELRRDLVQLNDSRKVDGLKEVTYGFGIHADSTVTAVVGPAGRRRESLLGEAHACARALENLAAVSGVDFLVTHALWDSIESKFMAKNLGEAKLTPGAGLMEYYWVEGYIDAESGSKVRVISPYADATLLDSDASKPSAIAPAVRRWLVNNGSQMVGPLDAKAIASQLFTQELDFDCECWTEGTGESALLGQAAIFSDASGDEGATHWAFDGKILHGPMNPGFLLTALTRGAIPVPNSYVCAGSTVNGWVAAETWRMNYVAALEKASAEKAAHESKDGAA